MGAAFSHGFDFGGDIAAAQKHHKQALADTELESNIGQANDTINGFRSKLSQYAPGSAEHEQAKQGLAQALQQRTQLFHPANNPTAMSKFGHMLLDHIPGRQPSAPPVQAGPPTVASTPEIKLAPQIPATNGTGANSFTLPAGAGSVLPAGPATTVQGPQTPQALKAQAEANLIASSAPTPPPGSLTPEEEHRAALIKAKLEPGVIAPRAGTSGALNPKNIVMGGEDGKTPGYYEGDGKFVPLEGHYTPPAPKAAPHSNAALQTFIRTKYGDNPTAEQYEEGITEFKRLQTPDTSGTHEAVVYDRDGNAHVVQEHSSSHKSFGGGGGSSRSTGSGKKSASGDTSSGRLLPGIGKNTPAQTKAESTLVAATQLKATADDAWSHPSAVKDKNLALAIIRGAAGRVNMQEYNILTKQAGIANTLEAWANKATTGQLPLNIRKQLVDLVHSTYSAASQARDASMSAASPGDLKSKAKANTQTANPKDPLGIF